MEAAQIVTLLEKAKTQKTRLEGQREQLMTSLKALGYETVEAAQAELDRIKDELATLEPDFNAKCEQFFATHADAIATLNSVK